MLWSGPLATGMSTQSLSKLWLIRTAAAYLGYTATGTRDVVWNTRERERERERKGRERERVGRVEGAHALLKGSSLYYSRCEVMKLSTLSSDLKRLNK